MKTVAIITAAGHGKRMGRPKQFLEIGGKPILEWTISAFQSADVIDEIILVVNKGDVEKGKAFKYPKLTKVVAGGDERQISVNNGLKMVAGDVGIVAIHDGSRPFISPEIIEEAVCEAEASGAVVVGVPVYDTIKQVRRDSSACVVRTLDRSDLWRAQTPQVFRKEIILKAYQCSGRVTDDAMLVEKMEVPVKMVMGSYKNFKITTPEDLAIAEKMINEGVA
ncbi:MAG: 2-C-methyl-D-erythritol 4-phosphate cytidylyltransferase [Candidatus Margulisiibacteriota bacterium]|nr:2-C-methyl-D-erythritol 4-phosphate cytidylyltransferase [Candidatus Margulisiibacteriota bacterium]